VMLAPVRGQRQDLHSPVLDGRVTYSTGTAAAGTPAERG